MYRALGASDGRLTGKCGIYSNDCCLSQYTSSTITSGQTYAHSTRVCNLFIQMYLASADMVYVSAWGLDERLEERGMVGEAGIEPATPSLEGSCSIRLSYSPAQYLV